MCAATNICGRSPSHLKTGTDSTSRQAAQVHLHLVRAHGIHAPGTRHNVQVELSSESRLALEVFTNIEGVAAFADAADQRAAGKVHSSHPGSSYAGWAAGHGLLHSAKAPRSAEARWPRHESPRPVVTEIDLAR